MDEGKAGARLIAAAALMGALSQFHRNALGVIAPELAADLGLDAAGLGAANAMFFVALFVLQLPIGIAFDRYGPRAVVSALTVLAAIGSAAHAGVADAGMLLLVRLMVGVGSAASFMAGVVLCSRWFAGSRLATQLSRVFALSQLGTLMAATPLAWMAERVGWRAAFVLAGAATAAAGVVWHAVVRDDPPGTAPRTARRESLRETLAGVREVLGTAGLARVLALHCFAYAAVATILGLWAAPFLHARFGLDPIARGNVVAAMTVAAALGVLGYGPLDRRLGSRKRVAMAGAAATILLLAVLALAPLPSLPVAVVLLCLVCAIGSYSVVIVAHGRSLFPDRLAGRGVTTVNLAQVAGSSLLPLLTGVVVNAIDGAAGFRAAFATIAVFLGTGLAIYAGAPEPPIRAPSGQASSAGDRKNAAGK